MIKKKPSVDSFIDGAKTAKADSKSNKSAKASKRQSAIALDQKISVYLSEDGIDRLEGAWLTLRKAVPKEDRKRISKSLIIEHALEIVLEDLEAKDEKSKIAKALKRYRSIAS